MLIESGDVIRYVFLLSVCLRPFILDVGSGGEPVVSSWEFVRLGGRKSGDGFGTITAGHVVRCKYEWVDGML